MVRARAGVVRAWWLLLLLLQHCCAAHAMDGMSGGQDAGRQLRGLSNVTRAAFTSSGVAELLAEADGDSAMRVKARQAQMHLCTHLPPCHARRQTKATTNTPVQTLYPAHLPPGRLQPYCALTALARDAAARHFLPLHSLHHILRAATILADNIKHHESTVP